MHVVCCALHGACHAEYSGGTVHYYTLQLSRLRGTITHALRFEVALRALADGVGDDFHLA